MKHVVILFLIFILSAGSCQSNKPGSGKKPTDITPKQDKVIPKEGQKKEDLAPWESTGNVRKASQWIDDKIDWLTPLGISKTTKSIVVNASNENVLSPGGGIDGALGGWAKTVGLKPWQGATLPNGSPVTGSLEPGKFAIFKVPFGALYLAVGPRASAVNSLEEAKKYVSTLYTNMLNKANHDGAERIVLPAISTAIFAGDGKGFSKKEFIKAIYEAMIKGIEEFQKNNSNSQLLIIVNNWDPNLVQNITALN
jgi:O-acetyl-ADP-ribose deacetylase (regulator of RNase III)